MFGRKKADDGISLMHYEGLPGFNQDAACKVAIEGETLIFENPAGSVIRLPFAKIKTAERMQEIHFMGKYHNSPFSTSKSNAIKWFTVITYDEGKYIALWDVSSKGRKLIEALQPHITSAPTDITL